MTHQHTSNGREWWIVEVPSDGRYFHTSKVGHEMYFCWQRRVGENKGFWGNCSLVLPDGTWTIHSDSLTITEEQAAEIVEKVTIRRYRCYDITGSLYFSALNSYRSLLRSKQINSQVINLVRI